MTWENNENISIRKKIWRLIANNFALKILSLAFAVVLFLIVRTEQTREYTRVARVQIVTNERMMVIGPQERAVYVTIKLPNSLFFKQPEERDLLGKLDVTNERAGKFRVRLSQDNFPDLDKRYTMIIHDPWLEVDLDYVIHKMVEVKVPVEGRPMDGFTVERVIVNPEQVEVAGARRELANVQALTTSVINIDGLDKTISSRTKIVIDENSSLKIKDEWVNVQVVLGPKRVGRLLKEVPLEVVGGAHSDLRPSTVDVELEGQKSVLDRINPKDVHASLTVKDLPPGWHERPVRVQIPPETSLVRVEPSIVSVKIGR